MTSSNNKLANAKNNLNQTRLIRRKEVQDKTGLGASSIYSLIAKGTFPKPLNLSERRVAWLESEIDAWVSERIAKHQAALAAKEA